MEKKWYVATLIMQCKMDDNNLGPWTCSEQIHVLRAHDEDEAYGKAVEVGRREEHSYQNAYGQIVSWEFVGLENLEELTSDSIRDGTEIRSRIFEADPSKIVSCKDNLTVYQALRNKHRTAEEIIDERESLA